MRVLIRADGGADLGMGHLVRCAALAGALRAAGVEVAFLTRARGEGSTYLGRLGLETRSLDLEQSGSPADVAGCLDATKGAEVLVVDHYRWTPEGFGRFRDEAECALAAVDDLGDRDLSAADLIVNQNAAPGAGLYDCGPERTCLLGPSYALLRPEIVSRREAGRPPNNPPRVLLTMGGADRPGGTEWALDALEAAASRFEIALVIGGANRRRAALEDRAARATRPVTVHVGLSASDMADLMTACDLAVTATGSTVWELCCLGVPIVGVVIADNQRLVAETMARSGAGRSLGRAPGLEPAVLAGAVDELLSRPADRAEMSARGRGLVDGRGAERTASEIIKLGGQTDSKRRGYAAH